MPKKIKRRKSKNKGFVSGNNTERSRFTDKVKKDKLFKGHEVSITTNKKEKMSEVLIDFAEPVLKQVKNDKEKKAAIAFAALIWNASLVPEKEQSEAIEKACYSLSPSDDAVNIATFTYLADILVDRKKKFFANNKRVIVDYHIYDTNEGLQLDVASTE